MSTQLHRSESPLSGIQIGTGAWSWGDRLFWGYGNEYRDDDLQAAFDASIAAGITFFDTAEIYGQGRSEQLLGRFLKTTRQSVFIATKFMPYPWRLRSSSLKKSLQKSLQRLDIPIVDLYQIHWPFPPVSIETWMDMLARVVQEGLTRSVGVSNFNPSQTRRAYNALARANVPLTSNQIEYSLLKRNIEKNGLLELCHELDIAIIAYSPLAQGLLTGKYTSGNPPPGIRGRQVSQRYLRQIQPLIALLHKVGAAHDGKSPAQVALNWTICKGTIPIPGAKSAAQVQQNAGSLGWQLTSDEVAELDEMSKLTTNAH